MKMFTAAGLTKWSRTSLGPISRRFFSRIRFTPQRPDRIANKRVLFGFLAVSTASAGLVTWLDFEKRVYLQRQEINTGLKVNVSQEPMLSTYSFQVSAPEVHQASVTNPDRPDIFSSNKSVRDRILEMMKDHHKPLNYIDFIQWSNDVCRVLGKELNLYDRVYKGKSQLELYEHLYREALHLSINKYHQRGDQSSWTLMGAKGIGKSAALRNFTDLGNSVFPNVIPVYISFNNVGLEDFGLKNQTICDAIFEELKYNWGIEKPSLKRKETKSSLLERTLLENNLYVLLLVDELDQLYRKDDSALQSYLYELISFANNPLGRIGTTICGSSAAMVDLITCNGGSEMFEFFPNLKGAPHMNGSKFLTIHISSNLPISIDTVSEITNIPQDEGSIKTLRLIMFAAGAGARRVGRQLDQITAAPQDSLSSRNTLSNKQASMLWSRLCESMIKKNAHIFDKIVVNDQLNFDAITNEPWEDEFKPLSYDEAAKIWSEMAAEGLIPEEDSRALVMRLFDLSDRTWIVLDGVKDGCPAKIYPSCLWHLARRRISDKEVPRVLQRLNNHIQSAFRELKASDVLSVISSRK